MLGCGVHGCCVYRWLAGSDSCRRTVQIDLRHSDRFRQTDSRPVSCCDLYDAAVGFIDLHASPPPTPPLFILPSCVVRGASIVSVCQMDGEVDASAAAAVVRITDVFTVSRGPSPSIITHQPPVFTCSAHAPAR